MEPQNQTPCLTLLHCCRTDTGRQWRCSIKKVVLKNFEYPQETPVLESPFKIVANLMACNLIKKRPQHRCFPVIIAKFSRLPLLKNTCFLTVSMVHCYMSLKIQGLDCMTSSGFRVEVTGLDFCFYAGLSSLEPITELHLKTFNKYLWWDY